MSKWTFLTTLSTLNTLIAESDGANRNSGYADEKDGNCRERYSPNTGPEEAHLGANDIGWQALAPALGCSILATTVVAARWYSRHKLARCVGVDDYVILLPLLLSWTMTTTIGISVHEGVGVYHSDAEASQIARLVVAGNVLWILVVNITKASILSQYLRIFCSVRTRTLCYALLACLLPAAMYSIFAGVLLCKPTAKLWKPNLEGICRSAQTYWLSVAGLDIGLDFLVLLLPLPAILALRLPPRQKIGLVSVFILGFFVCIVAVVRLVTVYVTAQQGNFVLSGMWAVIWNAVEANVGIICACLSALKPLAAKMFPSLFDETRLPRHAMHLKPVDTSGARWSQVHFPFPNRKNTGEAPPATPSSEDTEFKIKRWSSARTWVSPSLQQPDDRLSQVENLAVLEREEPRREGVRENVSIWDMLQQPKEVAVRDARRGRDGR